MVFKRSFSARTSDFDLSTSYLNSLSQDEAVRVILQLLDSGIFETEHLLIIRDNLHEIMLEEGLSPATGDELRPITRFRIEHKRIDGKVYIYLRSTRRDVPDKYIGRLPLEIGKTYRMQPRDAKTSLGEKIIKFLELCLENEKDIFLKAEVNGSVTYYNFPDCFKTVFPKKEWHFIEIVSAGGEETEPAFLPKIKEISVEKSIAPEKRSSQSREIISSTAPLELLTKKLSKHKAEQSHVDKEQSHPPTRLLIEHSHTEKEVEHSYARLVENSRVDKEQSHAPTRLPLQPSVEKEQVQKISSKKIDLTQQPRPKVVLNIAPEQTDQFIKCLKQWILLSEFPVTGKKWELTINNDLVVLSDKVERTTILTYRKDSSQIKSFYGARAILELMSEISFAVANSPSVGNLNCSVARRFFIRLEACSRTLPETTMLAYLFNVTEQK